MTAPGGTVGAPDGGGGEWWRRPKGHKGYLTLSEVEVYSAQQNVAPTGEARQSSTSHNAPAARAIDGKANGSFNSCSCSSEQQDAWWELDLGEEHSVDSIGIWGRTDGDTQERLRLTVAKPESYERLVMDKDAAAEGL